MSGLFTRPYRSFRNVLSINNSLIGTATTPASGITWTADRVAIGMAEEAGHNLRWTRVDLFNSTLINHWDLGVSALNATPTTARDFIRAGGWTDIILQDFSTNPLSNNAEFLRGCRLFASEIRAYCPTARIHVFLVYPYSTSADYAGEMLTIENNTAAAAADIGASVLPVGRAWNLVRITEGFATRAIYFDDRHPTLLGIYFNGLIFHRYFFGDNSNVVFQPIEITSGSRASLLQRSIEAMANASWQTFNFTGVNLVAGQSLGTFRAKNVQMYLSNINWNDGAGAITAVEGSTTTGTGTSAYSGFLLRTPVVYQQGGGTFAMRNNSLRVPSQFVGLDTTKEIFVAINDLSADYANNTGSFTINYRAI